jgi:hypothetical protein
MAHWLLDVKERATDLGHEVIDLEGENATRDRFVHAVNYQTPDIIVAEGHGDEDTLTAYMESPLLDASDLPQESYLVRNRSIYALSCLTASKLGPKAKDSGARLYAGYVSTFDFIIGTGNPGNDPTAEVFKGPALQPSLSLLEGKDPRGIYSDTMGAYSKAEREVFFSLSASTPFVLQSLNHDKNSFVVLSAEELGPVPNVMPILALLGLSSVAALGLWWLGKRHKA